MTGARSAITALVLATTACTARDGEVQRPGTASVQQSVSAAQLSGYYLLVVGTRSGVADLKYPCASHFSACLPVNADGTIDPITDLCPSGDSPETGSSGTGQWDFTYALFTDPACAVAAEVDCPQMYGEVVGTGFTMNNLLCQKRVTARGAIGDYVWLDDNHNGLQDSAEIGLSGVTVQLWNADLTVLLATTTTDANGYYLFDNLPAGTYEVVIPTAPHGLGLTTPNVGTNDAIDSDGIASGGYAAVASVTIGVGEVNRTIDFGWVGKTATIPNTTMEGAMTFPAGSWVSAGYRAEFSGPHVATTVFVHSVMHFYVRCQGSTGPAYDFVVDLGTQTYVIPANDTSYFPVGTQNTPASYMGSGQVPDYCSGGLMVNNASTGGATFVVTTSQVPPSVPPQTIRFNFHYRMPAAKSRPNYDCYNDPDNLYLTNPNLYSNWCSASWSGTLIDP